jgi:hypothetical protein
MTDETLRTSGYLLSLFFCAKSCFGVSDGTVCSGKEFRFRIGAAPYLPRFSACKSGSAKSARGKKEKREGAEKLKRKINKGKKKTNGQM